MSEALSDFTAVSADLASGDLIPVTDVSDTTDSASGTSKKLTYAQLETNILGNPSISGDATVSNGTNTTVTVGNQTDPSTESTVEFLGKSGGGTSLSCEWQLAPNGRLVLNTSGLADCLHINTTTGELRLNDVTVLQGTSFTSNNPLMVAERTWSGSGNTHAFVDEQTITGSSSSGHNSFDGDATYDGSNNYDHAVSFQARPSFEGSGTITNFMGFTSAIDQQTGGTVTNAIHYKAKDITGSGTVTNQYGFYVEEALTRAGTNWAFYSAGATASRFGGDVQTGGAIASDDSAVTIADAATTFAVSTNFATVTGDAGGDETIATITGGQVGMVLTLLCADALWTLTDTAANTADTVNLSAAFTAAANTTLTLVHNGTKWFETARSVN